MSNESIDIKDIKTTTELSQEEMDEVKGGAVSGGSTTTSGIAPATGTGGTSNTSGITKGGTGPA